MKAVIRKTDTGYSVGYINEKEVLVTLSQFETEAEAKTEANRLNRAATNLEVILLKKRLS